MKEVNNVKCVVSWSMRYECECNSGCDSECECKSNTYASQNKRINSKINVLAILIQVAKTRLKAELILIK